MDILCNVAYELRNKENEKQSRPLFFVEFCSPIRVIPLTCKTASQSLVNSLLDTVIYVDITGADPKFYFSAGATTHKKFEYILILQ